MAECQIEHSCDSDSFKEDDFEMDTDLSSATFQMIHQIQKITWLDFQPIKPTA